MAAYNFAFSMHYIIKKMYAESKTEADQYKIEQFCIDNCNSIFKNTKYNLDAILYIVKNNIKKYIESSGSGILTSYVEIGELFAY